MHPAELAELEAFRDLYAVAPAGLGARTAELGGALCIRLEADARSAMFNRVLGLGLDRPATEEGLERIASFYRDGIAWAVALAPQAEPPELPSWLERRGSTKGYGWTKFTRRAGGAPVADTQLRVERVEEGVAFAEAFVRGYGTPEFFRGWLARLPRRPGWHCFVAFDGGEPAGVGALYVTGAVGWLGIAATVPEHRRKGAQNAILAARVDAAAEAGCEIVATETGEPRDGEPGGSWRNIARAGFEPQYVRPNYLSSPEADTSGTAS
ncbi:MAG TPA: GNAT family N-acetyltransferase [Gaiellaceae bacterium]|nr:GNAT family N-acetyltransferase [Gaiellaceae bacterium]